MGLFDKLKKGLARTRTSFVGGLKSVLTLGRAIDEDLLEELEESLLLSDVGPATTSDLLDAVREGARKGKHVAVRCRGRLLGVGTCALKAALQNLQVGGQREACRGQSLPRGGRSKAERLPRRFGSSPTNFLIS